MTQRSMNKLPFIHLPEVPTLTYLRFSVPRFQHYACIGQLKHRVRITADFGVALCSNTCHFRWLKASEAQQKPLKDQNEPESDTRSP